LGESCGFDQGIEIKQGVIFWGEALCSSSSHAKNYTLFNREPEELG
jgi:hypothetical protein